VVPLPRFLWFHVCVVAENACYVLDSWTKVSGCASVGAVVNWGSGHYRRSKHRKSLTSFNVRFDTIRDAVLTCARKLK